MEATHWRKRQAGPFWRKWKAGSRLRCSVEVEGRALGGAWVESGRWNLLTFALPRTLSGEIVQGRLLTEPVWVPADEGLGADTRRLGIAVRRIWVE